MITLILNPEPVNGYGLSYSSLSKRAGMVRKRLCEEKTFKNEFDELNALINTVTAIPIPQNLFNMDLDKRHIR